MEGDLYLRYNAALTNVDGLFSLTTVGVHLYLQYNDALTNVDGLSSLTDVGGNLYISYNDTLCQDSVDDLVAACTIVGVTYTSDNLGTCP